MTISAPGIGSNLDINGIVSQLMAVERQPLAALDKKETKFQAQLSAYGSIKGSLSSLQNTMKDLASVAKFRSFTTSSSDATVVAAQAADSAVAGNYAIEVTALAQAQKLIAAGQASTTAAIGSGATTTVTFDFGTISGGSFDAGTGKYTGAAFASNGSGAKAVTLDSGNNTLAGIRDAINDANIGVTATIINDGGASPYRLVLSQNSSGKNHSVKISVSGDATVAALLAHDPAATQNLAETVSAQDAAFKVDGVAVVKSSNTVNDVIPGVTLSLLKTNAGNPANVSVTRDTSQITSAVNTFVKAYNDFNKNLAGLSAYNATTKQGAILNGDATARSLQAQIRAILGTTLAGTYGNYSLLAQIGVSFQKDGSLAVDATKLQSVIDTSPGSIGALFAASGAATDSLASFVASTANTKAGSYALNVTQLATKGQIAGSAAATLTINAGVNDTLDVTLGGVSASVTLAAGNYASASALAAEIQSKINGATAFSTAGLAVTVTESAGVITIASNDYGSAAGVDITGGNGKSGILGATPVITAGLDVAGSINGAIATGAGQLLTGATGDASEGLKIKITGGSLGSRGTIHYSQGYAYQLDAFAAGVLADTGPLASRTEGINKSITDINNQREALGRRLADVEKRYRAQFTALDTMISNLNKTSNFLTQQLAASSRKNNS
ncbi:MAG: flagellar filament capping protein FliD [Burkholderiales bacterium]